MYDLGQIKSNNMDARPFHIKNLNELCKLYKEGNSANNKQPYNSNDYLVQTKML